MNCAFCGKEFDETAARDGCKTCSMFGGCRNVRCPHCGYETPEEPAFVRWLRQKLSKGDRDHGQTDHTRD